MWNQSLDNKLLNIIPEERILRDEPMYKHTTFRVGGPVERYISISSEQELKSLLDFSAKEEEPFYLIGNGSNLLVSDKGLEGLCIEVGANYSKIRINENCIIADAGALLSLVAKEAAKAGLTGFEFAAGIPGSVGGAMVMNAGAYGSEMKDIVKSVKVYLPQTKEILILSNLEMEFDYRKSIVRDKKYVVLSVEFALNEGDLDDIKNTMSDLAKRRRDKQPLEYPSAGSTFKRPVGFFAGRLIEESGLKGYMLGGAQVSDKHAGFIINRNNANAVDIYRLIGEVREKVFADSGIRLETEVILLGDFS